MELASLPAAPTSSETRRLIVRSLGSASHRIIGALRTVSPLAEDEIAQRLLRAPAELFTGLPPETASQLAEVLARGGLVVDVDEGVEPVPAPTDLYEVCLYSRDPAQMSALAADVVELLGLDRRRARDHLCAAPCVLIGGVSEATVEALRRRLEPLGADINAALPERSRFDAYVTSHSPQVRARVIQCLADRAGVDPDARDPGRHLSILDIDHATAQLLWEASGRRVDQVRVINRAFLRYDLRLDAAPRTPAMIDALVGLAGMPARVAERVLQRLPMVVLIGAREAAARAGAESLAAAGASATISLATLAAFHVEIVSITHMRPVQQVLAALRDVPEERSEALLRRLPAALPDPVSVTLARWLQHELRTAGATVKLVSR